MMFRQFSTFYKIFSNLLRLNLSLAIAFTALTGYIVFNPVLTWNTLFLFLGVFLLSNAASALNQFQERKFDAHMPRTLSRPLPSRSLTNNRVLITASVVATGGIALLLMGTTPGACGLGIITLLWYNGLYTPLKPKTRYAVIIGAATGMMPPVIGYTAAGGPIISHCLFLSFFIFLWQVAHFLLLLVKYGKEYHAAGFPLLIALIPEKNLKRVVFFWILAASLSTLLFPWARFNFLPLITGILLFSNTIFILYFYMALMRPKEEVSFSTVSSCLYLFQGTVLILLIIDSFSGA